MSTYLALTFGTLLSSQGTDTSFGPPSSGPSGCFVLSCSQLTRCFPLRFPEFHSSDPCWPGPLFCGDLHISLFRDLLEIPRFHWPTRTPTDPTEWASSES
ncbi:hypothetical protein EH183_10395 [Streptomyces sp. CB01881]|nr:hypothetical protein C2142_10395 [Streptomyces sp. CB01881]TYC72666.1 hypothetical protein EH183_10395 [Streptomyces sp. CB01881]